MHTFDHQADINIVRTAFEEGHISRMEAIGDLMNMDFDYFEAQAQLDEWEID